MRDGVQSSWQEALTLLGATPAASGEAGVWTVPLRGEAVRLQLELAGGPRLVALVVLSCGLTLLARDRALSLHGAEPTGDPRFDAAIASWGETSVAWGILGAALRDRLLAAVVEEDMELTRSGLWWRPHRAEALSGAQLVSALDALATLAATLRRASEQALAGLVGICRKDPCEPARAAARARLEVAARDPEVPRLNGDLDGLIALGELLGIDAVRRLTIETPAQRLALALLGADTSWQGPRVAVTETYLDVVAEARRHPEPLPGLAEALLDLKRQWACHGASATLAVIGALRQIADPSVTPWLVAQMDFSDFAVIVAAIGALGAIGDERAIEPLEERTGGFLRDASVKQAAREAVALVKARVRDRRGGLSLSGRAGGRGGLAVSDEP